MWKFEESEYLGCGHKGDLPSDIYLVNSSYFSSDFSLRQTNIQSSYSVFLLEIIIFPE